MLVLPLWGEMRQVLNCKTTVTFWGNIRHCTLLWFSVLPCSTSLTSVPLDLEQSFFFLWLLFFFSSENQIGSHTKKISADCLALWLQDIGVSCYASCPLLKIMVSVWKPVADFLYALMMIWGHIPTLTFLDSGTSRPKTEHAPFHANGSMSDGALSLRRKKCETPLT